MTMDDIELVEFPYPDDWYDKPEMLVPPMNNPSELWMRRDHKHDLAFRPLETALLKGTSTPSTRRGKVFQHLQEATGKIAMFDLSKLPGLDDPGRQHPRRHHLHRRDGQGAPRARRRLHEGHDQGRTLGQREQARCCGAILNRQTFYLDAEDTYEGIKDVDMVPSLSAQNLQCVKIGKDFMFENGYIKNDFDVDEWAAPEFLEQAATEVLKEEWQKRSWSKLPAGWRARGRRHAARVARSRSASQKREQPEGPSDTGRPLPRYLELASPSAAAVWRYTPGSVGATAWRTM